VKRTERSENRIAVFVTNRYMISYCEKLLVNPPQYPTIANSDIVLRDYQIECIELIKKQKNLVLNLPTGTGKNIIMIHSMRNDKKYLILVPRIILMDQFKDEIIKHFPHLKQNIQLLGDQHNKYNDNKNITICVFNSVSLIDEFDDFDKIFVDEAHHIDVPELYMTDDETDTDDDNELTTSYIQIIKSLSKYKNNVYLSATIDKILGFSYYKKDIRDMIDEGYLCDYTLHIPIFDDDPTNKNICEYLLKHYRNIIVYCNSREEGKTINAIFNKLQNNSSEYIDCHTPKKDRNDIIRKYKKGDIPFIINVRILVEGFDSPNTKGIVFLHLPSSKTTVIQIIGRALRLHPSKTIANIILPFSTEGDSSSINRFINIIAKNDKRIRKSFENKKIGGYINLGQDDTEYEDDNDDEMTPMELRYEMIYSSMGKILNASDKMDIWNSRLEEVKLYMDTHDERPSGSKISKVRSLGEWTDRQVQNFKNDILCVGNRKKWIVFYEDKKYSKFFMGDTEKWNQHLLDVKNHIDKHDKRPSKIDKNEEIAKIGSWCIKQCGNYKYKKGCLKDDKLYDKWDKFIKSEQYSRFFLTVNEIFDVRLDRIKLYIDNNDKRPSTTDKNKDIQLLGLYISRLNGKKGIKHMDNDYISGEWINFMASDKYKHYFMTNDEKWKSWLNELEMFVEKNDRLPTSSNQNEFKLARWIDTQTQNYKKRICIMMMYMINGRNLKMTMYYYSIQTKKDGLVNILI
jgi:late competence protein required for DNA uptake (superfamily II DNA/RNA helicase)